MDVRGFPARPSRSPARSVAAAMREKGRPEPIWFEAQYWVLVCSARGRFGGLAALRSAVAHGSFGEALASAGHGGLVDKGLSLRGRFATKPDCAERGGSAGV